MNPYADALARLSLESFAKIKAGETRRRRVFLPYHRTICELLELWSFKLLPGGKRNLALLLPPRHSKTMSVEEMLEWTFGAFPDSMYLYLSHNVDLAANQARLVRETFESVWYREMFPDLRLSKAREDKLVTTRGGQLLSVGINGGYTGFGAGMLRDEPGGGIVIDDPMKATDAHSQAVLESVVEKYNGAIKSRKNSDDTPMLLVMQRLHEEDLAGYIKKFEADDWHFHEVRAYDEKTRETIWPERFSPRSAERMREFDEVTFYAQYQQSPTVPGGNIVKKTWWRWYDFEAERKANTFGQWRLFITADTASKTADANDYSAFQLWCATPAKLFLVDGICGKWEFPALVREAKDFYQKSRQFQPEGRIDFLVEDKSSGTPLCQVLNDAGLPATEWNPAEYGFERSDKVFRMKSSALVVYAGNVHLPLDNPYSQILVDETAAFTHTMTHAHDDNCDAFTEAAGYWRWLGGRINDVDGLDAKGAKEAV
jgi:predicted phage terminase large subunit-like protein